MRSREELGWSLRENIYINRFRLRNEWKHCCGLIFFPPVVYVFFCLRTSIYCQRIFSIFVCVCVNEICPFYCLHACLELPLWGQSILNWSELKQLLEQQGWFICFCYTLKTFGFVIKRWIWHKSSEFDLSLFHLYVHLCIKHKKHGTFCIRPPGF